MKKSGFSLVEITLGCVILLVAIIPLFSNFSGSHRNFDTIAGRSVAINASDEIIQQLYIIPFAEIPALASITIPASATTYRLATGSEISELHIHKLPDKFKRSISIVKGGNRPTAEIYVKIEWSDMTKDSYQEKLFIHDLTWSTSLPDSY